MKKTYNYLVLIWLFIIYSIIKSIGLFVLMVLGGYFDGFEIEGIIPLITMWINTIFPICYCYFFITKRPKTATFLILLEGLFTIFFFKNGIAYLVFAVISILMAIWSFFLNYFMKPTRQVQ